MRLLAHSMFSLLIICASCCLASGEYNWNKISISIPGNSDTLFTVCGLDSNRAIAAGTNGIIVYVTCYPYNEYSVRQYGSNTFRGICLTRLSTAFSIVHGWVVGDGGAVYSTGNQGQSWTQQYSNVNSRLNAVAAVDQNRAWIAGDSGIILHTSNGGSYWRRQNIDLFGLSNTDTTLENVDFVSVALKDSFVCIGGNYRLSQVPVVLMSCDGGQNWSIVNIPDSNAQNLYEVTFNEELPVAFIHNFDGDSLMKPVNGSSCFSHIKIYHNSSGHVNLMKFQDFKPAIFSADSISGFTWGAGVHGIISRLDYSGKKLVAGNNKNLKFVYFNGNRYGFIGAENGSLFFSENLGNTWEQVIPANSLTSLEDIAFSDSLNGYLLMHYNAGDLFKILNTGDGGRTWTPVRAWHPATDSIKGIHFLRIIDSQHLFGFGFYNFHFSSNGGKKWQSFKSELDIEDFFPVTIDTFFVAGARNGREGAIFKSTDRGETVDIVSSVNHTDSKDKYFYSITFSDPATGWVVGDSGIILKSSDSGYTWHRQPSPTIETLTKIRFCNPDMGWISGKNRIFLTFDAGTTWHDKSILTSTNINDVFCSDPENCWAVGDDSLILHLNNKPDKFIKILFPDKNSIFAPGDSLTVKWESGGISDVSIAVSYDDGQNYTVYRNSTGNDGEETIRLSANAPVSSTCKIRIRNAEGTVQNESEHFTITESNAVVNIGHPLHNKVGCHFTGSSIRYSLVKNEPVLITVYTVSGREAYRKCIPLQSRGCTAEKIPSGRLGGGCYLVRVDIGGRVFKGKLFMQR